MSTRSKCCIIGIPDHQGVIHVGGRVGSARGPSAFRKAFAKFTGKNPVKNHFHDLGDVGPLAAHVEENHRQAADFIREGHLSAGLSLVIGGGHDHAYSHLQGVLAAEKVAHPEIKLGCLNIDAHLDVRKPDPKITSGSPFYLALESGVLDPKRFIEFGIQSHCNSSPLWDYVERKGVEVVPWKALRRGEVVSIFHKKLESLASICDVIVVSFDLDAVASAYSPGVSAPQSEGLSAMEAIDILELAGGNSKVVSLGIFELNPEHDVDQRSAYLAATGAYHWLDAKFF